MIVVFFLSFFQTFTPLLSAEIIRDNWIDFLQIFRDEREKKYSRRFLNFFSLNSFPVVRFLTQVNLRNGKDLNDKTLRNDRHMYLNNFKLFCLINPNFWFSHDVVQTLIFFLFLWNEYISIKPYIYHLYNGEKANKF